MEFISNLRNLWLILAFISFGLATFGIQCFKVLKGGWLSVGLVFLTMSFWST